MDMTAITILLRWEEAVKKGAIWKTKTNCKCFVMAEVYQSHLGEV